MTLAADRNSSESTNISVENLNVTFLKDTVYQSGNVFSFNTITIINTGPTVQEFTIDIEIPQNWQQVFDNRKVFQIKPNEQLTLPLRIAATPSSNSMVYPIKVNIQTSGISGKTSFSFYAKVNQNSNWRAALLTPNLKLLRDTKETYFQIELINQGNQAELGMHAR